MKDYYLDKVAVVTGAASGLGLGFSERMLEYGLRTLWMADYDAVSLERESKRLNEKFPGKVFPVLVDCSHFDEVEALITRAAEESGVLDLVFNNAGIPMTYPSEELTMAVFAKVATLDYLGVACGALAALRIMVKQGFGHIINTASIAGMIPIPYQAAYGSSKAAVIAFTRSLHYEFMDTNIFFSQFSPGNVATNIFTVGAKEQLLKAGYKEEDVIKHVAEIRPPEDAIPVHEAIDYALEKISERQVDILIGNDVDEVCHNFSHNPEQFEKEMLNIAFLRRSFYEAVRNGDLNAEFPG